MLHNINININILYYKNKNILRIFIHIYNIQYIHMKS
jgi:hypothetical protein